MRLNRWLRQRLETLLRARGYQLREIGAPPRGFPASLAYVRSTGISPRTVFDVGVGRGTPWLYEAFPEAKFVLFEPLSVFEPDLERLQSRYGADVHRLALSNRSGVADFHSNVEFPTSSSLYEIDPHFQELAKRLQQEHRFERQVVTVDTLDRLNTYAPPYVIKLDVEGSEIDVLRGAQATLARTELLVTEMSVMRRLRSEPTFAEMIAHLDAWGFELFDIPNLAQARENGPLLYLDAVFVPRRLGGLPQETHPPSA